jgi:hypothetical protein
MLREKTASFLHCSIIIIFPEQQQIDNRSLTSIIRQTAVIFHILSHFSDFDCHNIYFRLFTDWKREIHFSEKWKKASRAFTIPIWTNVGKALSLGIEK